MLTFSPAKINLGLYVTGKREDGYHNLESLFLPIALYDAVEMVESSENELSVYGLEIPGEKSKNSCLLTLEMMQQEFDLKNYHIHLLKRNPMGAGLGGGSANAATIILMLNKLENLQLSVEEMQDLALQIGSDNAFFIEQSAKYVTGRGEVLKPCALNLKGYQVVLILPPVHQSTKEAYSDVSFSTPQFDLQQLTANQLLNQSIQPINSFQAPFLARFPATEYILQQLKEAGAIYSSLSGSGSSFYALFAPQQKVPTQLEHFATANEYRYFETKII